MAPLDEADLPVYIEVGQPASQERSLADIWSALGGELKPSLDLVVTAPIVVDSQRLRSGRRSSEGPSIGISSTGGASRARARAPGKRRGIRRSSSSTATDRAAAGQRGRQGRRACAIRVSGVRRPRRRPATPAPRPAPDADAPTPTRPLGRVGPVARLPARAGCRWSSSACARPSSGGAPTTPTPATGSAACTSPTSRSTGCSTGPAARSCRRRPTTPTRDLRERARARRGRGRGRPGATSGCARLARAFALEPWTSSCC